MKDFQISPRELRRRLVFEPLLILDIRSESSYHGPGGRIPGAVSCPIFELGKTGRKLMDDKGIPAVLVCERGIRSLIALPLVRGARVPVYSLTGGMKKWKKLGFDLVRDSRTYPVAAASPDGC